MVTQFRRLRFFLIRLLAGRMAVALNFTIDGSMLVEPDQPLFARGMTFSPQGEHPHNEEDEFKLPGHF